VHSLMLCCAVEFIAFVFCVQAVSGSEKMRAEVTQGGTLTLKVEEEREEQGDAAAKLVCGVCFLLFAFAHPCVFSEGGSNTCITARSATSATGASSREGDEAYQIQFIHQTRCRFVHSLLMLSSALHNQTNAKGWPFQRRLDWCARPQRGAQLPL
jgi:hypothetical protein